MRYILIARKPHRTDSQPEVKVSSLTVQDLQQFIDPRQDSMLYRFQRTKESQKREFSPDVTSRTSAYYTATKKSKGTDDFRSGNSLLWAFVLRIMLRARLDLSNGAKSATSLRPKSLTSLMHVWASTSSPKQVICVSGIDHEKSFNSGFHSP